MKKRVVVSRPSASMGIVAGVFGVIALIILFTTLSGGGGAINWGPPLIGILCCLALGIGPALHAILSRVVADENGLRWRTWTPWKPSLAWKSAVWEEVTDFYVVVSRSSNDCKVETANNPTLSLNSDWEGLSPLREAIAERATHANAARDVSGKLKWMRKGMRLADFPVTFAYAEKQVRSRWRKVLAGSLALIISCVAFDACLLLALLFDEVRSRPEAWGVLGTYFMMATLTALATGWILRRQSRNFRDAQQRAQRGERFVAEQDGLIVWQDGDSRRVPWKAIIGYEFPLTYSRSGSDRHSVTPRIRTDSNDEYTTNSLIENYSLLTMILRACATEAVEYKRDQNDKEALGGVAARWSGGEEGKGDRVFHRRTRTVGMTAGLIGFFFALSLLLVAQCFFLPEGWIGLLFAVPGAVAMGTLFYLSIAEYRRERFQVGTAGVTYVNKHGKERRLTWDDIAQERIEGNGISLEGKNGEKIQLDATRYAYGNELPALLTERLVEVRRSAER